MQPFIGSRIKLYRTLLGKTQEQLSVELDVTKQHLGLIERGESNPSMDLLNKICTSLKTAPANIFLGYHCTESSCTNPANISRDIPLHPVSCCGTLTINIDNGNIFWSESLCRLIGKSSRCKQSLQKFLEHIDDAYKNDFIKFYTDINALKIPHPMRCVILRGDGQHRTIQIQADITRFGQNAEALAVLSFLDITEFQASQSLLLHNQQNLEAIIQNKTKSLGHVTDKLEEQLERRVIAEQLLREKSEQLERLFEAVPAILYTLSMEDFQLHYYSPHAERILGHFFTRQDDSADLPWHKLIHPHDRSKLDACLHDARAGNAFSVEYRIKDQSSEWRWFHDEGSPRRDETGKMLLLGVVTEITQRKLTEEELTNNRTLLIEAEALAGMGCFEWDIAHDIWSVSENFSNIAGTDKRRFTTSEMLVFVPVQDHRLLYKAYRKALNNKIYNIRHRVVRKNDGKTIHVHGYGKIEFINGAPRRMIGAVLDVTEHWNIRNALSESEINFRTFFNTIDDLSFVTDLNGTIIHANSAVVSKTGYALEELRGTSLLAIHEPSMHSEARDMFMAMINGRRTTCTLPIVTKGKKLLPVESRIWMGKWNGKPCVYGMSKDLYRTQSALLRLICDNVPDMIWAKDLEKRYIFANTAVSRDLLNAADTDEPISKTDLFFAQRERERFPDNPEWHSFGEICRDTDQITMDAGRPMQFDEYGNVKGQFMFLDVHKAPLLDDHGIMIGTVGSARDVTEERRIASALEASNATLTSILDSIPAEICVTDFEAHRILFANKALKRSFLRDCTGEECHQVFHGTSHPCASCPIPQLLDQDGRPLPPVVSENVHPVTGKWYHFINQAIVWVDGRMAKIQIAMDITERKQMEDTLRSERDLFSNGPVLTIVWNPSEGWPMRYVSANSEEVLGYTPQEMTEPSFTYTSLIHPDDLERVQREVSFMVSNGAEHFEQSYRLRTKTGAYRWFYDFTNLIRNTDGQVTTINGYIFDQSQIKEMEQALHNERQRLAAIIDGTNVGTWEWHPETGYTLFDEQWASMIGYTLEEISPTSIQTWVQFTHPEDLKASQSLLEKHFDGEIEHYECEARMRHKDGRWIWILDRGKVSVWSPDGRPLAMQGTHQDITARKNAEEELRRVNLQLQSIIDALPGSLNVVDTDYRIIRSNRFKAETIFEKHEEEFKGNGQKCFEVFQNRQLPCPWCKIDRVLATGKPEFEVTDPDDPRERVTGRAFQLYLNPVKDKDGSVMAVVEYGVDVTELRQAREQALAANQAKSAFLANMSHEIRTPLNGIMGMLELLQYSKLDLEQQEFASTAVHSCRRLVQILSDILDLSRIEANMLTIHNSPMDLTEVVGQIQRLFAAMATNNGVHLKFRVDPAIPNRLSGDGARIQQVLTNLVSNALKFTKAGNISVDVSLISPISANTCRVLFCVSDTGIGIPGDKLSSLFKPFSQIENGYTRTQQGSGLGLSICKRLVELMGGDISVASEEGVGTSMYFRLTFQSVSAQEIPSSGTTAPVSDLNGMKVLLVEDDPVSGLAGTRLLQKIGADVTHVDNGLLATEALQQQTFHLVLLDIQLPLMSGIEVTRCIRGGMAGNSIKDIPIIALTAHAMSGDRDIFEAAGADGYVPKPFNTTKLLDEISRIFKKRRA